MKRHHIGIALIVSSILLATPIEEMIAAHIFGLTFTQAMFLSGIILVVLNGGNNGRR